VIKPELSLPAITGIQDIPVGPGTAMLAIESNRRIFTATFVYQTTMAGFFRHPTKSCPVRAVGPE
jgi:hypothetical protein